MLFVYIVTNVAEVEFFERCYHNIRTMY